MSRASRYIFNSFLFRFFLFFTFFLFFYLLVDFTLNFKQTLNAHASFATIVSHYAKEIVLKLDLLLPICFLFSLLITLHAMTSSFETIALQSLGISPKTFLKPIQGFSWAIGALLLLSHELLLPRFSYSLPESHPQGIQMLNLSDGSLLVFHHYDAKEEAFFDTYWIKGASYVFCEKLAFGAQSMEGTDCLFFHCGNDGTLHYDAAAAFTPLFDMPLIPLPSPPYRSWELCSLSELLLHQWDQIHATPTSAYTSACGFWHHLALPFLTPLLLTLFSKSPLVYQRNKKITPLILIGLMTFLSFFTLFKALFVLSEFHIIPPYLAALIPYLIFSIGAMMHSSRS